MSSNKDIIDRLLQIASALHDAKFDEFGDDIADLANKLQAREPKPPWEMDDKVARPQAKPPPGYMAVMPPPTQSEFDRFVRAVMAEGGMMPNDALDAMKYLMPKDAPAPPIPVFVYESWERDTGGMQTEVYEYIGDRKRLLYTQLDRDCRPHPAIMCDVQVSMNKFERAVTLRVLLDGKPVYAINGLAEERARAIYENQKRVGMIPNHPPKYGQKWEL